MVAGDIGEDTAAGDCHKLAEVAVTFGSSYVSFACYYSRLTLSTFPRSYLCNGASAAPLGIRSNCSDQC